MRGQGQGIFPCILHPHSSYALRRAALQNELLLPRGGALHADELVRRAAELEYGALAVTDRNSLAGVVRAHMAAKDTGLPLIVGAEITPTDAPPVVLWATDRAAYGRLCRLITRGRRQAPKGECKLALADVAEFAEGLIAGSGADEALGVCRSRRSRVKAERST